MARRRRPVPPTLQALRQRFENWRSTRTGKSRIPDSLWDAAAELSRKFGVCITARECRLNSDTLKKHVERDASVVSAKATRSVAPQFVELDVMGPSAASEFVLEVEERGVKLRIAVKGDVNPDLTGIVAAFRSKRR
jgi:hypothetical protein